MGTLEDLKVRAKELEDEYREAAEKHARKLKTLREDLEKLIEEGRKQNG